MSDLVDIIAALEASGAGAEMIIAAVKQLAEQDRNAREEKAALHRAAQAKYKRSLKKGDVSSDQQSSAAPVPDKEKSPTPSKEINPTPSSGLSSKTQKDRVIEAGARDSDFQKDAFARWYEVYPRKKARQAAERAFVRIAKSGKVTFAELMAGAQRLAASGRDPQYTPHPATWLNAGSWSDEPDCETASNHRQKPTSRADTVLAVGLARIARAREAGRVPPSGDHPGDADPTDEDGGFAGGSFFGQAILRGGGLGNLPAIEHARPERGDTPGDGCVVLSLRDGAGGCPDLRRGGGDPTLDLWADGERDLCADPPAVATGG